jgi:EF-P beta-lysylation protein EpmB
VLLIAAGMCGINCRYCFRREFSYDENHLTPETLAYIQQDSSIREVILSGGDPLVISDRRLRLFVEQISAIPHVKTLRIHSRMPVVSPERITDELLDYLSVSRLRMVLVLHTNHPQEIDHTVETAIQRVRNANITVLNQSVLLRGVNDSVETLVALSERLFDIGVLPYYLHLLDKVRGSAHFEVDQQTAKTLVQGMIEQLPGYLVPRLVFEEAGKKSKTVVM